MKKTKTLNYLSLCLHVFYRAWTPKTTKRINYVTSLPYSRRTTNKWKKPNKIDHIKQL